MPQSKSKKSAAGTGNIRKKTVTRNGKTNSFWEARYTEGYDPGTGKQIQRSISGKTQKEVAQKLKAATAAIDAGTYIAPSKMTFGEWLDIWVTDYLGSVKPITVHNYKIQVNKYLKPNLGNFKLDALQTHTIQHFYNSLKDGKIANLAPKTIRNIHGILHKALQQAVANGYLRTNPADPCILPKMQKPEIKPLEQEQIADFVGALEGESYTNLFTAAIFTGMRQGELLGLAWDAVDFQNGIVYVKQQLQCIDGVYFLNTPKSGKPRTIVPAPFVMDALLREYNKQNAAKRRAGTMWQNPWNLVFTDDLGKHLVRRTVVKHFDKLAEKIGAENARFHDLRHTYAVTALQAGDDIKTVQSTLGHATAAFTLDV